MSAFEPTLYISIGQTGAMYTLRETYQHYNNWANRVETRSFHHYNLSTDFEEAKEKASYAVLELGLTLQPIADDFPRDLRDIQRMDAAEREKRRIERAELEKQWEEDRKAETQRRLDGIQNDIYPFTRHDEPEFNISELPVGKLNWFAKNTDFEDGTLAKALQDYILTAYQDKLLPEPEPGFVGEIKKRDTYDVKVIARFHYERASFSGWGYDTVYISKLYDKASKKLLVVKSAAFRPTVGDDLTIKATVKEHDTYKGEEQTIIQRVTVMETETA